MDKVYEGPLDNNIIMYLFYNKCFKDALFGNGNLKRSLKPYV